MIVVALILTSLGVADIVRSYAPERSGALIAAASGVVLAVTYGVVTGVDWWWIVIAALLLALWEAPSRSSRTPASGVWLIAAPLGAVAAALIFAAPASAEATPIAEWYRSLPYAALSDLSFDTFALGIGCVLFLVETSNVMVRLVLNAAKAAEEAPTAAVGASGGRRWTVLLPFRGSIGVVAQEFQPQPAGAALRGGRIIGPLERVFIFALALAGEFTAIGAVVAAKGIVRFPEISKNGADGSKAEEFLIGSFSSWALVVVAAMLVNLNL